jgi:HupE / UreJ protein
MFMRADIIAAVIGRRHLLAAGVLLAIATSPAGSHDLERTQVALTFAGDGSFVLEISNDPAWLLLRLESFAGGQVPTGLTDEARDARLRELSAVFVDRIVLFVDGREVRPVTAEYLPPIDASGNAGLPALATFRLRGRMPHDARTLRWLYGLVIDPYPLTIRRADGRTMTEWIQGSDWSGTLDLSGQFRRATRLDVARDYVALGFTHILPTGLDHILFVLGLFLLSVRIRPILIQVTTFTIAHSITLALTMYGVVSLPSRVVEPLIALSIAYVAFENLVTDRLRPWRLALVFSFGLLHGMGFAGVLSDLGLPRDDFLTALLSFNLGVEAGQLTVIAMAALLVIWYRHRAWYHQRIVVPASLCIAAIGMYWTVTRVLA